MNSELREKIKAWLDEQKYYYKFLDKSECLFVSRSEKETGWFIEYIELEFTDLPFEIVINKWLDRVRKAESPDEWLEEDEEDEENDELYNEISKWVDSARYDEISDRIYNAESSVIELEDRWEALRKMVQDTIISLHESAKDPESEFIKTTTGTLGRVLNMMKELEGEDE